MSQGKIGPPSPNVQPPKPAAVARPVAQAQPQKAQEPVRAKELASVITSGFPEARVDYMKERRLKLTVPVAKLKEVALTLRDRLGFDHLSVVSCVDWIAKNEFEVIYFVGSVSKPGLEDFVVALATRIPRDNPVLPSLLEVWTGVDYHERETQEMFGINFEGNPAKGHFLLPEDWNDLPPLRKDYVSPGR